MNPSPISLKSEVIRPCPPDWAQSNAPPSLSLVSVQVMNEGPGHIPLNKIPENMKKQLEW